MSSQPLPDVMGQVLYPELHVGAPRVGEPTRNPYGRPRYKLISDAMIRKVQAPSDVLPGETAADEIAAKVVQVAKAGDMGAVVILRDSIEGRPAQAISLDAHVVTETTEERRARLFTMLQVLAAPQEEP